MSVSQLAPSSTVPPVHHLRNLAITVGAIALAFALGIGAGLGLHSLTQTTEPQAVAQGAAVSRAVPGVAENNMTDAARAEHLRLEAATP